MPEFFYRPDGAYAADFIPFYDGRQFRLFYLQDWRSPAEHGEGTPWRQISTHDFVRFTEHGEAVPRGSAEEQDLYVFTGSVIQAAGQSHLFYTGHNPHFRRQEKPEQAVMHAVSDDLLQWRKIPEHTFFAPEDDYEPHDWRDPFVFWNEDAGEYWMLLAARRRSGPSRRRGCLALCASTDLQQWRVLEPFWSPGLYFTHECPDLFRMGEWWYLVYSTFSERHVTHYRMSRSLQGPWQAPENDTFDGRAYYAAKSASDGRRRFLFGWAATREGEKDSGPWQWGGNLVVHELRQEADGTLCVAVPESVDQAFGRPAPFQLQSGLSRCEIDRDQVRIAAPEGFGCAVAGELPDRCKIEARISLDTGTRGGGLMLRCSDDLEAAYYVRLEPGRNRLVFDSWPRPGDRPFAVELERPLDISAGQPISLQLFVDGSVCVVYAAGRVAMSTRLYDRHSGQWGAFVNEGAGSFEGLRLSVSPEDGT
jgi:beta-fructofuranosidase